MEIRNDQLKVTFRFDPSKQFYHRFEAGGVAAQVEFTGKERHEFCEPEQYIDSRFTCEGQGLLGEYVWDRPGMEARKDEFFMKPGVGLLKQVQDNAPYSWADYREIRPFPVKAENFGDLAVFTTEPLPCNGYAVRIIKRMQLTGNTLVSEVTLENRGEKPVAMAEYQHNFVSVDYEPIGPGYRLSVPFVKNLHEFETLTRRLSDREPVPGIVSEEGGVLSWKKSMAPGYTHILIDDEDQLDTGKGRFWRLENEKKGAYVEEHFFFEPKRTVIWGIEHCMCVEVYAPVTAAPGESTTWKREWKFGEL